MAKSKSPVKQPDHPTDLYPVDVILKSFKTKTGKNITTVHVNELKCNLNFLCLYLPIPDKNLDLNYSEMETFHVDQSVLEIEMKKEWKDLNGIYSVIVEGESDQLEKIVKVLEFKKIHAV